MRRAFKVLAGAILLVLLAALLLPPSITARLGPLGDALDTVKYNVNRARAECQGAPPPEGGGVPVMELYIPTGWYRVNKYDVEGRFEGRKVFTTSDGKTMQVRFASREGKVKVEFYCNGKRDTYTFTVEEYIENRGILEVYHARSNTRYIIKPAPHPLPGGTITVPLNLTVVSFAYTIDNGTKYVHPALHYSTGQNWRNSTITLPTGHGLRVRAGVSLSWITVEFALNRTPADRIKPPDRAGTSTLPFYIENIQILQAGKPVNMSEADIRWKHNENRNLVLVVKYGVNNIKGVDPVKGVPEPFIRPGESWTVKITVVDGEGKRTTFVINLPYPEYAWELRESKRMSGFELLDLMKEWAEKLTEITGHKVYTFSELNS